MEGDGRPILLLASSLDALFCLFLLLLEFVIIVNVMFHHTFVPGRQTILLELYLTTRPWSRARIV
jgi:hypothetical protein